MAIAKHIRDAMESSSWIRRMFEAGIELKQERGESNVFDLSLGNPIAEPPQEFRDELRKWAENPKRGMHRYMPNAGFYETREAIATGLLNETNIAYQPSHILMTVGAGGALNCALHALCDPGDQVIIFRPFFAEYQFYANNHSAEAVPVDCDSQFLPDMDDLASKINSRTKAVIINSPNNPSGVIYNEDTIASIADLIARCSSRLNIEPYIISDEPYRKILFDSLSYAFPQKAYSRTISVTSHSKDLALAGERIGYAAVHPDDPDASLLMDALVFSNRVLGFVNAPALMQTLVARLQNVTVDIADYELKRNILYKGLSDIGFELVKPQGAFYAFPKAPIQDELSFINSLYDHGVLVVPGRGFGLSGHFRISYCVENSVIEQALPIFEKVYKEFTLT
ncbi:MAG: aspartate aminotransferase [Dehalococcoidia bacterium]|nr:aspartate aminotransferase [Dehalococcoidia bacterium]